ncbi:MAG TPA: Ech hydrogenase subunit EchB [Verrucomicrobia bacterium]|nr:MAG: Ech hydrogenase subunit EchB [Lentisphaerae bacterium GWF2_57_35]HBA83784.1 Ech hydrogenase subunit EchB [Verrucomicrobiota bacterium]
MKIFLITLAYLVLAPVLGGLLAGFDRIVTARMQSRVGPPLFQPFYDVLKLMAKENLAVNHFQNFYILCFLVFMIITGALFFAGGDLLLAIFALTLAGIFLVMGAYSANSPYSIIGAERELILMMAYEPMLLIAAIGLYMATGTFIVHDMIAIHRPLIFQLPGIFLGLVYILTIKFRKSPFDLSTSHHGHQEIVKGLTTEFSGPALAMIEVAHWYENILLLGLVYLFFAWYPPAAVAAVILTYFFEIFIDNTYARTKWHYAVKWSWAVAATLGVGNVATLYFLR